MCFLFSKTGDLLCPDFNINTINTCNANATYCDNLSTFNKFIQFTINTCISSMHVWSKMYQMERFQWLWNLFFKPLASLTYFCVFIDTFKDCCLVLFCNSNFFNICSYRNELGINFITASFHFIIYLHICNFKI